MGNSPPNSPRKEETKREDYVISAPIAVRQVEFVRPESLQVIRIIKAKKEVILEDKEIEEKFKSLPPITTTVQMRSEKHWYGNSETMRINYFPLERSLQIASELQGYYKECGSVVNVNQTILFKKMRETEATSVRVQKHFATKVGEVHNFERHMLAMNFLVQKIHDSRNRLALIEIRLAEFERVMSVAEERAYYARPPGGVNSQSVSPNPVQYHMPAGVLHQIPQHHTPPSFSGHPIQSPPSPVRQPQPIPQHPFQPGNHPHQSFPGPPQQVAPLPPGPVIQVTQQAPAPVQAQPQTVSLPTAPVIQVTQQAPSLTQEQQPQETIPQITPQKQAAPQANPQTEVQQQQSDPEPAPSVQQEAPVEQAPETTQTPEEPPVQEPNPQTEVQEQQSDPEPTPTQEVQQALVDEQT